MRTEIIAREPRGSCSCPVSTPAAATPADRQGRGRAMCQRDFEEKNVRLGPKPGNECGNGWGRIGSWGMRVFYKPWAGFLRVFDVLRTPRVAGFDQMNVRAGVFFQQKRAACVAISGEQNRRRKAACLSPLFGRARL